MTTKLTSSEVVAWMREQAQLLNDQADVIESIFSVGTPAAGLSGGDGAGRRATAVEVEKIKQVLSGKKMRIATLAGKLHATERAVERALKDATDITKSINGWYSLPSEGEQEESEDLSNLGSPK